MATQPIFNIYFSSIKAGEKVYLIDSCSNLITFVLNADKGWSDKTIDATVVNNDINFEGEEISLYIGRKEPNWCADMFFTFKEYPCNDETLSA